MFLAINYWLLTHLHSKEDKNLRERKNTWRDSNYCHIFQSQFYAVINSWFDAYVRMDWEDGRGQNCMAGQKVLYFLNYPDIPIKNTHGVSINDLCLLIVC